MALPVVFLAGMGIRALLAGIFRVSMVQGLIGLAIYAIIAIAGYFAIAWLLPDWLSVEYLSQRVLEWHPGVHYALSLISFADGLRILFFAVSTAWVLKKFPPSFWIGGLYRLFRSS